MDSSARLNINFRRISVIYEQVKSNYGVMKKNCNHRCDANDLLAHLICPIAKRNLKEKLLSN
jgi:hypothetical protein